MRTTQTIPQGQDTASQVELYMSFELADKTWKLTISDGRRGPSRYSVDAGDPVAVLECLTKARKRCGLSAQGKIHCCYEAGRDGWWLHRWLIEQGIDNIVVDAASIEVNRRARRAKTDRLDGDKLLVMLLRQHAGERVWSVLREPSAEAEDARRTHRELGRLMHERIAHTNRIGSLLVLHNLRPHIIIGGRDWAAWWEHHGTRVCAGRTRTYRCAPVSWPPPRGAAALGPAPGRPDPAATPPAARTGRVSPAGDASRARFTQRGWHPFVTRADGIAATIAREAAEAELGSELEGPLEWRQVRRREEDFDCPRLSRHTANEAAPFEPHEHRIHRRRREVEESLQVGMALRHASPIGCNVLGDIGQELSLLARGSAGRCRGLGATNAVCGVELVQRRVHGIGSELHRVARLERGLVDDDPVVEHGLKPCYALT